ncbi:ankyrin-1a isoform X8 [Pangasianodon hypophthalmus]|uniref:ankyrin-1a isoform X8 n=1 Tax=Pangasianodon hypophthalmus TaxID=310915 RepID=UPI000EFF0258|nr:ankyrin-1a isoform X8 [Pangasianodon hypophthalmus]
MWTLVTELLFSFVVLAFLVLSCQSVLHIASGTVRSVLTYIHRQLDRELGEDESLPDQEENVTTRVVRRRVILKGDEAVDLPGEQVSEEQFTDEHGNIVTKKVVRKVVRRGKGEGEGQEFIIDGQQEADELDADAEQFMGYAVLGRESKPDVVDVKKGGAQIVKCATLRRVKQ